MYITKKVVGIDFGTKYIKIAYYDKGKVTMICDEATERLIPNLISFTKEKRLIGRIALTKINRNYNNTVAFAHRYIGTIVK